VDADNSAEYISVNRYPTDDGARGSFLDRVPHTRLITHQFLDDLQSDNEGSGPICPDNPLEGPEPRHTDDDRRPWIYMGPGLHQTGDDKIHIRLSPTHNGVAGFPDFDGESDPRKVPLAIWTKQGPTFKVERCRSLYISDITIRHGDVTVAIHDSTDIRLDHVDVLAGNDGIRLRGTCDGTILTHCLVDGGLPPWYFRSDRKDEFHLTTDVDDFHPQAPGQNTMKALLSGTAACSDTIISYCEFVNGHDISTFGTGTRFSHNWIRNIDDDAIIIDTEGSLDVRIFGNVLEQCQTAISSGTTAVADGAAIYRNLFDLRRPITKTRPRVYEKVDCDKNDPEERQTLALGVLYKSNQPDGPLNLFQNTCVVKDNTLRSSFNHFSSIWGQTQRNVFNNIFVAVNSVLRSDKPIAFVPSLDDHAATDGNCFYRTGQYVAGGLLGHRPNGGTLSFDSLRALRGYPTANDPLQPGDLPIPPSPYFLDSQQVYQPGFEAASIEGDPLFRHLSPAQNGPAGNDDLRLSIDSPARNAGVELAHPLDDLDTEPTAPDPDIGCFPYGAVPLAVGVNARRRFPSAGPPAGSPA
jgi:hypothetical protein